MGITRPVRFANGCFTISENKLGFRVKAAMNAYNGDWKTDAIHGTRILYEGEEMIVDGMFVNLYGLYLSGKNPRGQHVDLEPRELIFVGFDPNPNHDVTFDADGSTWKLVCPRRNPMGGTDWECQNETGELRGFSVPFIRDAVRANHLAQKNQPPTDE